MRLYSWQWILIYLLGSTAAAQVNTEALRKQINNGWQANMTADLSYTGGNSEHLRLKTGARLDYTRNRLGAFLVGNYQRGLENEAVFINKGFIHARMMQRISNLLQLELFAQKEFNDFIKLRDRDLLGSGLRWRLLDKSHNSGTNLESFLGTGVMWEYESLETTPIRQSTNQLRSTNYLSMRWKIEDRMTIVAIAYYQISLENAGDYRALAESSLGFNITRRLVFRTSLSYRYDNEPPGDIKRYDLEITNGLSVQL